ncbi:hypothetical protein [Teredinibacter waterburyi]|jgi:hypothetical protein|uniref:hypothetical protein n=1 Tax=Teredinibacter waterburyi TaxID=1500538 RepID=UPI00165F9815|nr:hypothetical protein [Teredinibacter waterburyi]
MASSDSSGPGKGSTPSSTPTREKRGAQPPIPRNLEEFLNEEQLLSLRLMRGFGWSLAFIRRPLFQEPLVVVTSDEQNKVGILEPDGSINTRESVAMRH